MAADNFPYTNTDYLSDHYKPTQLTVKKVTVTASTTLHYRDEVEFLLIVSGAARIEINHTLFDVQPNQLIQLMPFHVHRFLVPAGQQVSYFRLRLSLGLLIFSSTNKQAYLEIMKNLDKNVPIATLNTRSVEQLSSLLNEAIEEEARGTVSLENLNLAIASLTSYYFKKFLSRDTNPQPALGWLCIQYIHFHHQDPLTLAGVATKLGIATTEVQQELRRLTGLSFKATLNQVRIRNAYALLQFPDLSINQIGQICGFQTEANFYKQFQLVYATTPQQARENMQPTFPLNDAWNIAIYLLENCYRPLLMTELVTVFNLSKDTINNRLQESFGLTYKELLTVFKKQVIKNLTGKTTLSEARLLEIERELG
jgi:AraC-like DNA-binding protein